MSWTAGLVGRPTLKSFVMVIIDDGIFDTTTLFCIFKSFFLKKNVTVTQKILDFHWFYFFFLNFFRGGSNFRILSMGVIHTVY